MKRFQISNRWIPVLLAAVTLAAYGLFIPWLGFYWDDWAFAFLAHQYGPLELVKAFSGFRPFLGPIFAATTSLLGTSPLPWQIFGLVIRFCLALSLWWTLKQLWPVFQRQILTVTLVFLVFPGYSQQWVALTHINQELISLVAYILSFGFTIRSVRNPQKRNRNRVIALGLGLVGLITTEYFIGYEFIRLGVLLILEPQIHFLERAKNALRGWLHYLALWLANAAWLAVYYRSGSYHSYSISAFSGIEQPGVYLLGLLKEAVQTITTAGFLAWWQAPNLFSLIPQSQTFRLAIGLFVLCFAGLTFFRTKLAEPGALADSDTWAGQAIGLGLIAILVGRLPSWVAGLPFVVQFDYDRFFISIMLGASLLLAGVIEVFIKPGIRRIWVSNFLIVFAICAQFINANNYRRDWENQADFFQQLTWRAPGLKPGTMLLTDSIATIPHVSDMGLTAALNWTYEPNLKSHELPYLIMYSDIRLGMERLPDFTPGQPVQVEYRTAQFNGNTSQTIVFYQPESGCIHFVDPQNPVEALMPDLPEQLTGALPLSDLSLIQADQSPPELPKQVFGNLSPDKWCTYYQKAELARSQQDWDEIILLAKQAVKAGVGPVNPLEFMPFIEAYIQRGNVQAAAPLMAQISTHQSKATNAVCVYLKEIKIGMNDPKVLEFIQKNAEQRQCPQ
jgi:hypothetical protein